MGWCCLDGNLVQILLSCVNDMWGQVVTVKTPVFMQVVVGRMLGLFEMMYCPSGLIWTRFFKV